MGNVWLKCLMSTIITWLPLWCWSEAGGESERQAGGRSISSREQLKQVVEKEIEEFVEIAQKVAVLRKWARGALVGCRLLSVVVPSCWISSILAKVCDASDDWRSKLQVYMLSMVAGVLALKDSSYEAPADVWFMIAFLCRKDAKGLYFGGSSDLCQIESKQNKTLSSFRWTVLDGW